MTRRILGRPAAGGARRVRQRTPRTTIWCASSSSIRPGCGSCPTASIPRCSSAPSDAARAARRRAAAAAARRVRRAARRQRHPAQAARPAGRRSSSTLRKRGHWIRLVRVGSLRHGDPPAHGRTGARRLRRAAVRRARRAARASTNGAICCCSRRTAKATGCRCSRRSRPASRSSPATSPRCASRLAASRRWCPPTRCTSGSRRSRTCSAPATRPAPWPPPAAPTRRRGPGMPRARAAAVYQSSGQRCTSNARPSCQLPLASARSQFRRKCWAQFGVAGGVPSIWKSAWSRRCMSHAPRQVLSAGPRRHGACAPVALRRRARAWRRQPRAGRRHVAARRCSESVNGVPVTRAASWFRVGSVWFAPALIALLRADRDRHPRAARAEPDGAPRLSRWRGRSTGWSIWYHSEVLRPRWRYQLILRAVPEVRRSGARRASSCRRRRCSSTPRPLQRACAAAARSSRSVSTFTVAPAPTPSRRWPPCARRWSGPIALFVGRLVPYKGVDVPAARARATPTWRRSSSATARCARRSKQLARDARRSSRASSSSVPIDDDDGGGVVWGLRRLRAAVGDARGGVRPGAARGDGARRSR